MLAGTTLRFLPVFSLRKNNHSVFYYFRKFARESLTNYISGIFWTFMSKLQRILLATYFVIFHPDSNNCFLYSSISASAICLFFCFYFTFFFIFRLPLDALQNLAATFNSILLQSTFHCSISLQYSIQKICNKL